ncbi:MAG: glutamine--fructose-6-phosphate transaminase (isomerizing) [Anaerolineae bacterium]
MCGIVGYVGRRDAASLVLEGLRRLEYRGYDSAGLAVVQDGAIAIRRCAGKLQGLVEAVQSDPVRGQIGIGHTRWATHGEPCERNAHPHTDCRGRLVVVHNGIVENYLALREELQKEGHRFTSDTDTEVIVHLVERQLIQSGDLVQAVRQALLQVKGAHGIVVLSADHPDRLVAARLGNAGGVVVGAGQGEMFVASDLPALLEHTRRVYFLEHGEMAIVTEREARFLRLDGSPVAKKIQEVPWNPVSAAKGPYRHFMQKEIHEQAQTVGDTMRGRVDLAAGEVHLPELGLDEGFLQALQKVVIVACGTSAYAAQVGKFMLEALARIPVEVDYGSEFRYRDPLVDPRTLVVAITQSGETVDTLAAMEEARRKGARLVSIVNVIGSQAARIADGVIYMQAGPEIGVASTKAFTASLVDLYLLGVHLASVRGTLDRGARRAALSDLALLPDLVGRALADEAPYEALANQFHRAEHFLYLGRGINYPVALEGALKLKEISYIHAEGYPAGEMKHGPIALVDETMPVVALVPQDLLYDKMVNQVEQVKARGGVVIALATEGDRAIRDKADYVLYIPPVPYLLSPVVAVVPLQLLAYHLAVRRGCDVDQPRNLAKSVTVE